MKAETNKILAEAPALPQPPHLSAQVAIAYRVVGVLQQLSQCLELNVPTGDVQGREACGQRHG